MVSQRSRHLVVFHFILKVILQQDGVKFIIIVDPKWLWRPSENLVQFDENTGPRKKGQCKMFTPSRTKALLFRFL